MSTLAAAVDALGNGWNAEVIDSANYGSWSSDELLIKWNSDCLDETYAYLEIPATYLRGYEIDTDNGYIHYPGGFAQGIRNIIVDYTAGYSTIPDDLEEACLEIVNYLWKNYDEKRWGKISRSEGPGGFTLETTEVPRNALIILDRYRDRRI
jgi:hypothetical protein